VGLLACENAEEEGWEEFEKHGDRSFEKFKNYLK